MIPARLYQRDATPLCLCDIIRLGYIREVVHLRGCVKLFRLGYIREVLHLYGYVTLFG